MILTTILQEIEKKYLVVEWLSWLPCKRDFINSTVLETYEDIPNTLPSLKLLEQRVHELVLRSTEPPPPPHVRQRCGEQKAKIRKCMIKTFRGEGVVDREGVAVKDA